MNIPTVVLHESFQTSTNDEPTRPDSQLSKIWGDAATDLAKKLTECSQVKQRCLDMLDTKGAQEAYKLSKELRNLASVLSRLETFPPEMAATLRRQSVDRIVEIYEDASRLLVVR